MDDPNDKYKFHEILKDKIKVRQLLDMLHVSNIRTALRWCKKQKIEVMKFGRESYIHIIDFQLAIDRPLINALKMKYPETWKEVYDAYKKNDYITIADHVLDDKPIAKSKFVVSGKAANDFMKKMKQKLGNNE